MRVFITIVESLHGRISFRLRWFFLFFIINKLSLISDRRIDSWTIKSFDYWSEIVLIQMFKIDCWFSCWDEWFSVDGINNLFWIKLWNHLLRDTLPREMVLLYFLINKLALISDRRINSATINPFDYWSEILLIQVFEIDCWSSCWD